MLKLLCELVADLWYDESGAVVIEYTMLATVIAMAILTAVQALGTNLSAKVADTVSHFQ
jgi:Flp pilus assembly pilin Flp